MLTQEQRQEVGNALILVSKLYDKALEYDVAKMIVDDLQDLECGDIIRALMVYRQNPKNSTWPRAAAIRAIIKPQPDSKDFANDLARRIDKAVSTYGYGWDAGYFSESGPYWEVRGKIFYSFKEAVIEELGEVGWHVICSRGGWLNVRNSANEMDEGIFIAQMRDQIQSSYSLMKQGIDITQIEMPRKSELALVKDNGLERISINLPYKED